MDPNLWPLSLVAGPRNQRYWQPVSMRDGLIAVTGKSQDAGQVASKIDSQSTVPRREDDLVDYVLQSVARLGPRGLLL